MGFPFVKPESIVGIFDNFPHSHVENFARSHCPKENACGEFEQCVAVRAGEPFAASSRFLYEENLKLFERIAVDLRRVGKGETFGKECECLFGIVFVPLIKGVAERFIVPASQVTFEEFRERKRAHGNRLHFKLEGVH